MKVEILLIIVGIMVISCQEEGAKRSVNSNVKTIELDSLPTRKVSIKKHQYIPLENGNDFLLTGISEVIPHDSLLHIFDQKGKTISTYNLKNSRIAQIHRIGAGPGEYVDVWDMDVDKNGNIWLYDLSLMKLIRYTYQKGELSFKEYNIGKQCLFIGVEDSLNIFLGSVYEKGKLAAWLGKMNLSGNKYLHLMKNEEKFDLPYISSTYFFRSKENLFFYKKHGEYLYLLSSGEAVPYLHLASKQHPSREDLNICQQEKSSFSLYKKRKINEIGGFYETDTHAYLCVNTIPTMHIIIDKKNFSISQIEFDVKSELNGHLKVVGATEKYFVGYYLPSESTLKYLKNKQENVYGKDLVNKLTEEANPILLMFNFQEDE